MDLIECTIADFIILDTLSHIKFFIEKFKVPIKKFSKVYVGARDDLFFPVDKANPIDNGDVEVAWIQPVIPKIKDKTDK